MMNQAQSTRHTFDRTEFRCLKEARLHVELDETGNDLSEQIFVWKSKRAATADEIPAFSIAIAAEGQVIVEAMEPVWHGPVESTEFRGVKVVQNLRQAARIVAWEIEHRRKPAMAVAAE